MNVTFTPVGKHRTKCIMKNEQLQMLVNGKLGCLKKGTIPMPTPWKLNIVKHGSLLLKTQASQFHKEVKPTSNT